MSAPTPIVPRRLAAARDHLAGGKAARVWQQNLAAAHLDRLAADRPHTPAPSPPPPPPATGTVRP